MNAKKKPSEMNLEELYAEKKKLYDTFFNPKSFFAHIFIAILSISMALYVLKDNFSYILTGIIIFYIYSASQKFIYRNQIDKEIKARNL
jgi:hypothetical protein